jgi:hypothetical protein
VTPLYLKAIREKPNMILNLRDLKHIRKCASSCSQNSFLLPELNLSDAQNLHTAKYQTQHTPLANNSSSISTIRIVARAIRSMAKYEKLFHEEVKDGAIYLHPKDPSIKKTDRIINSNILPAALHTCHVLENSE